MLCSSWLFGQAEQCSVPSVPPAIQTSSACVWTTLTPQVWQSLSSIFYKHPLFFLKFLFRAPESSLEALCGLSAAF